MTAKIKRNKKNAQHVVPRTYLKHWKIADSMNFVYGIDFSNKYQKGIQTFGLNDKVFKERKYYNHHAFENSYILEDIFGKDVEPMYDIIMNEINNEINLSQNVREKIMHWLYVSKMRSPYLRSSIEATANFIYKTSERFNGKELSVEREQEIERHAKVIAKETQMNAFESQLENLLTLYIETFNAKHWRILKSMPQFEFLTNDNPGFSPNMIERFAIDKPYHHVMELNAHSIIFYPLSPKYCLEIMPFEKGTSLEVCALNMDILFEQASKELIQFINNGIFYTCNKILVSNNKRTLKSFIK